MGHQVVEAGQVTTRCCQVESSSAASCRRVCLYITASVQETLDNLDISLFRENLNIYRYSGYSGYLVVKLGHGQAERRVGGVVQRDSVHVGPLGQQVGHHVGVAAVGGMVETRPTWGQNEGLEITLFTTFF